MQQAVTDIELISRYKKSGDVNLVGELYKRHTVFAFGVCMKYLKDEDECHDAVMQIFEKLMVDLKKHEVENFRAWLHTVTRNHCLMYLRSRKKFEDKQIPLEDNLNAGMESAHDVHPEVEKEQMLQYMEEALDGLNDKQRLCVDLFYLKQKSYEEVASETGFSMNEVKSFIQNGKRNLKIAISKRMNHSMLLAAILFLEKIN